MTDRKITISFNMDDEITDLSKITVESNDPTWKIALNALMANPDYKRSLKSVIYELESGVNSLEEMMRQMKPCICCAPDHDLYGNTVGIIPDKDLNDIEVISCAGHRLIMTNDMVSAVYDPISDDDDSESDIFTSDDSAVHSDSDSDDEVIYVPYSVPPTIRVDNAEGSYIETPKRSLEEDACTPTGPVPKRLNFDNC